jgi:hypothetical protein
MHVIYYTRADDTDRQVAHVIEEEIEISGAANQDRVGGQLRIGPKDECSGPLLYVLCLCLCLCLLYATAFTTSELDCDTQTPPIPTTIPLRSFLSFLLPSRL